MRDAGHAGQSRAGRGTGRDKPFSCGMGRGTGQAFFLRDGTRDGTARKMRDAGRDRPSCPVPLSRMKPYRLLFLPIIFSVLSLNLGFHAGRKNACPVPHFGFSVLSRPAFCPAAHKLIMARFCCAIKMPVPSCIIFTISN